MIGYLLDNIQSLTERRSDGLERHLSDAEGQKLFGPALVGFVVIEANKDSLKSWCGGGSKTALVCSN